VILAVKEMGGALRAETGIVHKLDDLAGSLDRSRNYEYLETHTWQVEKITQGIAAADRGKLVAHDDVMCGMEDLMRNKK
jgi:predicted transcriptional regulator